MVRQLLLADTHCYALSSCCHSDGDDGDDMIIMTTKMEAMIETLPIEYYPFTPKFKKCILPTFQGKCMSEVVRIGSVIIFHLS